MLSSTTAHDIVRGRQNLIWSLLARITEPCVDEGSDEQPTTPTSSRAGTIGTTENTATSGAAPSQPPQAEAIRHLIGLGKPYTADQVDLLTASLVQWIHALGYLPLPPDGAKEWGAMEAADAMLHGCRDGTLLCDLAQDICGAPIPGVTRRPRVAAAARSNVGKACDALRQAEAVSLAHLRLEEQIAAGGRGATLSLLEAMHRAYDGLAPSKASETPYLGLGGETGLDAHARALEEDEPLPAPPARRGLVPRNALHRLSEAKPRPDESPQRRTKLRLAHRSAGPSMIPQPSPNGGSAVSQRQSPRDWDSPTRRRRRQTPAAVPAPPLSPALRALQLEAAEELEAAETGGLIETKETVRLRVSRQIPRFFRRAVGA